VNIDSIKPPISKVILDFKRLTARKELLNETNHLGYIDNDMVVKGFDKLS